MYKLAKLKSERPENVHIDIRRQGDEMHYNRNELCSTETL
jgi:hypothetical protein